jgi:hypothetical protein
MLQRDRSAVAVFDTLFFIHVVPILKQSHGGIKANQNKFMIYIDTNT